MKSTIGLIGLGVMGQNLARNIADKKISTCVYNRTSTVTDEFITKYGNDYLCAEKSIQAFLESLERPRKVIILVKAGAAVDAVIKEILPFLERGDVVVECGNSFYKDSRRRFFELKEKNINFVGCGVSGGEEGALRGPSLMPGGSRDAWQYVEPIFKKIAAKDFAGQPCVSFIGEDGAGHYVKMAHNGIEYAIMQLLAEAYDYLRLVYNLSAPEIAKIIEKYNKGPLQSFLLEITAKVLQKKDDLAAGYLIDHILDVAAQKGTGKRTSVEGLDRGVTLPTITGAVFARYASAEKDLRLELNGVYNKKNKAKKISQQKAVKNLERALYSAVLLSYAEGFELLRRASQEEKWNLNLAEIARIWQGGCIIRAKLLGPVSLDYKNRSSAMGKFLTLPFVVKEIKKTYRELQNFVSMAALSGLPMPAFGAAWNYFSSLTQRNSSAVIIQGLRDYFGAHTYERTDRPGTFHSEWAEKK